MKLPYHQYRTNIGDFSETAFTSRQTRQCLVCLEVSFVVWNEIEAISTASIISYRLQESGGRDGVCSNTDGEWFLLGSEFATGVDVTIDLFGDTSMSGVGVAARPDSINGTWMEQAAVKIELKPNYIVHRLKTGSQQLDPHTQCTDRRGLNALFRLTHLLPITLYYIILYYVL